ncbi:hypothetical protein OC709_00930 ['Planchonia careya' phytoplasma]|nr:hypothetical protein ['Planchonia careya' phytoplasma]MDO8030082.1 hypothetical protein ['Planchonia careya' phytoplasma]
MFNIKKKFKIIFSIFVLLWSLIIIFIIGHRLVYKTKEKQTSNYDNYSYRRIHDQSLENRKLVEKLAYLGFEHFKIILKDETLREQYNQLADDETLNITQIEEKIFNRSLNTAETFLIQSTIDFLSKKINKTIILKIKVIRPSTNFLTELKSLYEISNNSIITLDMQNYNNQHFYIKHFNDTPGDGYCFFHALKYLLDQSVPDWLDKICKELNEVKLSFSKK